MAELRKLTVVADKHESSPRVRPAWALAFVSLVVVTVLLVVYVSASVEVRAKAPSRIESGLLLPRLVR